MRGAKQKEMFEILDLRSEILNLRSVCLSFPRGGGGGGGGVLLYFHAHVDSGYFWGFKILNFNIFGGFQKTEYFWDMKILWILWGHHKIGLYNAF